MAPKCAYHHEKLVIPELKPEASANSSELAQVLEMMIALESVKVPNKTLCGVDMTDGHNLRDLNVGLRA
jgi:hypothetical protein